MVHSDGTRLERSEIPGGAAWAGFLREPIRADRVDSRHGE